MEVLFKILLGIHILSGGMGLITGTVNIVSKKGDNLHKSVGKFFLYGMLSAGFSSLALAVMHPNYFLFIVGIFTIYMVSTGQRYLNNKKSKPSSIDWVLTCFMLVFGCLFVGLGAWRLISSDTFGVVLIVFGLIALNFVKKDFSNYAGRSKYKNGWLLEHIQRMSGSYIASTTAFLVVNVSFSPSFVLWLLPTAVVTPFIIIWSRKNAI